MEDNGFGRPLEDIYRGAAYPFEFEHNECIRPGEKHTVLFEFPCQDSAIPKPYSGRKRNYNEKDYVRLPCYSSSVFHSENANGEIVKESLWTKVELSLLKEFNNSWELERAIRSYNNTVGRFTSLHEYFNRNDVAATYFFNSLLNKIIELALSLPDLIKTGIPLLKQSFNRSISLSQQQIACLLANAFLCTFPSRRYQEQYCPEINFNRLFESSGPQVLAKIECIINYFHRVCIKPPLGVLTFTRRSIRTEKLPKWSEIKESLSRVVLHIKPTGTIEDDGIGLLQVDFANKFIGGGVLGGGCVQEEIRFVICPELIVSRLFTEFLKDNEALLMIGAEQFSSYTGYGYSFRFYKDYKDKTPVDKINKRRHTHIVAIDAYHFANSSRQYEPHFIKRELNKAFVGFTSSLDSSPPPGVATGNWGCGAFGGDKQLKALIQLMACTLTSRPLLYFTFEDKKLCKDIYEMYMFLINNEVNIQQLFQYLCDYKENRKRDENLFSFIKRKHEEKKNSIFYPNTLSEQKNQEEIESSKIEKEMELSTSETESLQETPLKNEFKNPWLPSPPIDQEKCYQDYLAKKDDDEPQFNISNNTEFPELALNRKSRPRALKANANSCKSDSDRKITKKAKTETTIKIETTYVETNLKKTVDTKVIYSPKKKNSKKQTTIKAYFSYKSS